MSKETSSNSSKWIKKIFQNSHNMKKDPESSFLECLANKDALMEFQVYFSKIDSALYFSFLSEVAHLTSKKSDLATIELSPTFVRKCMISKEEKGKDVPSKDLNHYQLIYEAFYSGEPKRFGNLTRATVDAVVAQFEQNQVKTNVFDDSCYEIVSIIQEYYKRYELIQKAERKLLGSSSSMDFSIGRSSTTDITDGKLQFERSLGEGMVKSGSFDSLAMQVMSKKKPARLANNAKNQPKLVFTRDCFIKVLDNKSLYEEFKEYGELDLCHENFLFYEAYMDLVQIVRDEIKGANKAKYLYDVFLQQDGTPLQSPTQGLPRSGSMDSVASGADIGGAATIGNDGVITEDTLPLFQKFYQTFIAANGEFEVNIDAKLRSKISKRMVESAIRGSIFDDAAIEVLNLLYLNIFRKFVNSKTGSANSSTDSLRHNSSKKESDNIKRSFSTRNSSDQAKKDLSLANELLKRHDTGRPAFKASKETVAEQGSDSSSADSLNRKSSKSSLDAAAKTSRSSKDSLPKPAPNKETVKKSQEALLMARSLLMGGM